MIRIFGFLVALLPVTALADMTGQAWVVDGDTIEINGREVDLFGIDAPEREQTCRSAGREYECGALASRSLARIIGRHWLNCRDQGTGSNGSPLVSCMIDTGNVNKTMVWRGWAVANTNQSEDYVPIENEARAGRRGLWTGEFVPPWKWRAGERLTGAQVAADAPCPIKGDIDADTNRLVYHLPKDKKYVEVEIDELKGERWFCTEAEAQGAGWARFVPKG